MGGSLDFVAAPGITFTSPGAAVAGATFTETPAGTLTVNGATVAPGDNLYLRWTYTGSTGSGNRDEVGIDNVLVDTAAGGGDPGGPVGPTITPIFTIQGSGDTSPLAGQAVTTRGVVTAISAGLTKGFYLQDPAGDGDVATSDGILVFTGSLPPVAIGDLVTVTGRVQEFLPRNTAAGTLATTELSGITDITTLSRGNPLPAPVVIGAGGLPVPTADLVAANAFFERLEGMLVTVKSPLVVGPTDRFGEIFTVADGGAGATGLNARGDLLIQGGDPVFGATDTVSGDFNPERIQIDPGLGVTLPQVSTGARLGDVTGVVGYDFGSYQVLAKQAPAVISASPLTKGRATLVSDANHLLVGSYNAENLDPGDGAARFATIAGEVIAKLNTPDILALQEVQDNTGPTDDGTTAADATLQMVVDAIAAAGGPRSLRSPH